MNRAAIKVEFVEYQPGSLHSTRFGKLMAERECRSA